MERILRRCNFKSVMGDENDLTKLCIVPFYRDIPIEEWHCILVTRQEARALREQVPEELQQRMSKTRQECH